MLSESKIFLNQIIDIKLVLNKKDNSIIILDILSSKKLNLYLTIDLVIKLLTKKLLIIIL